MKKIGTLLLCAAMMILSTLPMCVTASAAGYIGSLLDYDDCFLDEQEVIIRELLARTAGAADCNVGVVTSGDLGGASPLNYTEDILESCFGENNDSIMLLLNNDFDAENYSDWIAFTGTAADRYNDEVADIFDEVYAQLETDGYLGAVVGFCNYLGLNSGEIDDILTEEAKDAVTAEANNTDSKYKAVIDDMHDMLSDYEEADLTQYMRTVAANIKCHVGIVITDDLEGMSDKAYAEDFAKSTFGHGSDLVVLLINNDRSNDEYTDWIYTYGLGTEKFDPAVDGIFDSVYSGMGDYQENIADYDYYSGIINFCYALDDISENGDYSYYYNYNSDDDYYVDYSDAEGTVVAILVPVIISGVITLITVGCITSGYAKKKPISARHYMDASRTRFLDRRDVYLRETTTSVKISSSSSGGGGSRGGGGGRSRSGGGGGGGRRR